jgi:signal peptidase II
MDAPSPAPAPATRRRLHLQRFVWVALLVALDLWTKSAVFDWLERTPGAPLPEGVEVWERNGHWRYPVVGEFFSFMLSENRGAAWGMGHDIPYLLVGGRVVAVFVLGFMLVRTDRSQRLLVWALVLVLAGALGNLHDNLVRTPPEGHPFGAVRDFLHLYFARWDYHFPTFNVADSCITVGAVHLILSSFFPGRPAEEVRQVAAPQPADDAR